MGCASSAPDEVTEVEVTVSAGEDTQHLCWSVACCLDLFAMDLAMDSWPLSIDGAFPCIRAQVEDKRAATAAAPPLPSLLEQQELQFKKVWQGFAGPGIDVTPGPACLDGKYGVGTTFTRSREAAQVSLALQMELCDSQKLDPERRAMVLRATERCAMKSVTITEMNYPSSVSFRIAHATPASDYDVRYTCRALDGGSVALGVFARWGKEYSRMIRGYGFANEEQRARSRAVIAQQQHEALASVKAYVESNAPAILTVSPADGVLAQHKKAQQMQEQQLEQKHQQELQQMQAQMQAQQMQMQQMVAVQQAQQAQQAQIVPMQQAVAMEQTDVEGVLMAQPMQMAPPAFDQAPPAFDQPQQRQQRQHHHHQQQSGGGLTGAGAAAAVVGGAAVGAGIGMAAEAGDLASAGEAVGGAAGAVSGFIGGLLS